MYNKNNKMLSDNANRVLTYLKRYIKIQGYAPTQREIGNRLGISGYEIQRVLVELEFAGKIKREHKKPRAITVNSLVIIDKEEVR